MLYDAKHDLRSFLKFVREQQGTFDYNTDMCAVCQFRRSQGRIAAFYKDDDLALNSLAMRAAEAAIDFDRVPWSALAEVIERELV